MFNTHAKESEEQNELPVHLLVRPRIIKVHWIEVDHVADLRLTKQVFNFFEQIFHVPKADLLLQVRPLDFEIVQNWRSLELEGAVLVVFHVNPVNSGVERGQDEWESVCHTIFVVDVEGAWHKRLRLVIHFVHVGEFFFEHSIDVHELDVTLIIMSQMLQSFLDHVAVWQLWIDKRNEKWPVCDEFAIGVDDRFQVVFFLHLDQLSLCVLFGWVPVNFWVRPEPFHGRLLLLHNLIRLLLFLSLCFRFFVFGLFSCG